LFAPQAAKGYCREIFELLKTLKRTRDMSVNEVKLVVAIEDPRSKVGGTSSACNKGKHKQHVMAMPMLLSLPPP
jgi:hypothetical protein